MKRYLKAVFLSILISFMLFAGCSEYTNNNNTNFDNTQTVDCPTVEEVDQLEEDFKNMRDELVDYMLNTEYDVSEEYPLNPSGNITEEGRQKRLEYEEFRDDYMDVAFNKCKNSSGVSLHTGSVIWLKGYDLIKKEIHPETFLGLPIFNKRRILYEEPNYWSGETTKFVEYSYADDVGDYRVCAYIRGWAVGTTEDQWQWLAREQNFPSVGYVSGQSPGSTVHYTNDYVDDYDWRWKGIYFQTFGFKCFAGYYSWGETIGTTYEYFKDIEITEDVAREMYAYLAYRPGYHELTS
ncbi:MAG: hypothetical protein KAW45_01950 [Thermoplasmatales archaeon]|nr:hypothetical protein [Thermoplasmatales archaeon]